MKLKKAKAKRYVDKGSKENVIIIKPTLSWFLFGGVIMITKDDFKGGEATIEYF